MTPGIALLWMLVAAVIWIPTIHLLGRITPQYGVLPILGVIGFLITEVLLAFL